MLAALMKHMDSAVFLNIHAIFQNNFAPISTNCRTGADVAIFANDHIAGNRRKRMHETAFVDYGNVVFEGVNHLLVCSF